MALKPGQPLDEMQLAARFGMSRSPIREALSRLLAERMVVVLQNRTTIVAPINLLEFPHYIEALDLHQRYSTRLAARHRSEADLVKMHQLAKAYDKSVSTYHPLDMSRLNSEFHLSIAEAGRNPFIIRQYGELLNEGRRLHHLHAEYLTETDRTYLLNDQHLDLIEAIADRDVARADALAHQHTMQFQQRFLEAMSHEHDETFDIEVLATRAQASHET